MLDDVQDVGSEDGTMTYSVSGMSLQNVEVDESGVTVRIQPGLVDVVIEGEVLSWTLFDFSE